MRERDSSLVYLSPFIDEAAWQRYARHCVKCAICKTPEATAPGGLCRTGRYLASALLFPRRAKEQWNAYTSRIQRTNNRWRERR